MNIDRARVKAKTKMLFKFSKKLHVVQTSARTLRSIPANALSSRSDEQDMQSDRILVGSRLTALVFSLAQYPFH